MAIAFDNQNTNTALNATSCTVSLTVGAVTNGYLVVAMHTNTAAGDFTPTMTLDGVAMTQLDTMDWASALRRITLWGKVVTSGTKSIVGGNGAFNADLTVLALSYSGVHQTVSTGTAAHAGGSDSTSVTVNITSASGEMVVDLAADAETGGTTLTPDGSQTLRSGPITITPGTFGNSQSGMSEKPGSASTTFERP